MDQIDFVDLVVVVQESMIEFERLMKCYISYFLMLKHYLSRLNKVRIFLVMSARQLQRPCQIIAYMKFSKISYSNTLETFDFNLLLYRMY